MRKKLRPNIPPVTTVTTAEYQTMSISLDYLNPNVINAPIGLIDENDMQIGVINNGWVPFDINQFSNSDRNKWEKAVQDIDELILTMAQNLSQIEVGVISDSQRSNARRSKKVKKKGTKVKK